jgi:hypothetical protein
VKIYIPKELSHVCDQREIKNNVDKSIHRKKHKSSNCKCRNNGAQIIELNAKNEVIVQGQENWEMNEIQNIIKQILEEPHCSKGEKNSFIKKNEEDVYRKKNDRTKRHSGIKCELENLYKFPNDSEDLEDMIAWKEMSGSDTMIEDIIIKNVLNNKNYKQKSQVGMKNRHKSIFLKRKKREYDISTTRKYKRQKH